MKSDSVKTDPMKTDDMDFPDETRDWRGVVSRHVNELDLEPSTQAEVIEEWAQDLEQRYDELIGDGLTPDQAYAAVVEPLESTDWTDELVATRGEGGPPVLRSQTGQDDPLVSGGPSRGGWLADLRQDLRYATRTLLRHPGFTAVAVLTLALGVGATTAIFGLVDAILLRPLPYEEANQLYHLFEVKSDSDYSRREASWPDFIDWSSRDDLFAATAGYNGGGAILTGLGTPRRVTAVSVTGDFFTMLGTLPAAGRLVGPEDCEPGAAEVVVLTHRFWQANFGGEDDAIGQTLNLSGTPYTIVGVLPASFQFPLRGAAEIWVPLVPSERQMGARAWHWLDVIARLRPEVTPEQAQQEMEGVVRRIGEEDPQWHSGLGFALVPLRLEMVGSVRPALLALAGTVGLLLLIVCGNLASLTLARAAGRRQELAVRASLGAVRWRLVRQLMTESLVLATIGGAIGLLVAQWGTRLLLAPVPQEWVLKLPYLRDFSPALPVFGFALAVAAISGLVFGLAPALRASRLDLAEEMHEGRVSGQAIRGTFGRALVVGQVALALVLLVGAGLVTRSLFELTAVSPGFNTTNLLTARLGLPSVRYPDEASLIQRHGEIRQKLDNLAGVDAVATVNQLPLTGRGNSGGFKVYGRDPERRVESNIRTVSDNYFDVLGIPTLDGRTFDSRDGAERPEVVLVNQTLADRIFGGDAIGQRISFTFFDGEPWWEIVGVVGDERVDSLDTDVTPIVYFNYDQAPFRSFNVVMRTAIRPEVVTRAMQDAVRELDAEVPIYDETTMNGLIDRSMPVFLRRYVSQLIGGFALLAALLAAIGVYGVTAYSVEQRRHEIGLRVALGAAPGEVLRMVLFQGVRLAAVGVVLGLLVSVPATRALVGLLYGVSRADGLVLTGVVVLLVGVVVSACGLPALRAMRVDPLEALRAD